MDNSPPAAGERERRKHVKLRLRRDLIIESQRYEGKTFFVVKDPVSLRYYRLKDNEHFLLQYLDGERTLEDAQKAYEKHFRPDRLKLEDLEAFGQQLIKAGLAQNDSPKAGKQLFDNRKKRLRTEWFQTLTNILYIKIPVFDPDRLLTRMKRWLGWICTVWFGLVSVGIMLSAALLVATHFETFRSKLPDYHAYFNFTTVGYLWLALGIVKVIHEFGHGLSCKVFGGEVHEMGALFLCLSPALYCNVSDAWTLPNKWHRIIISAAGIWVELLIAAIATFAWWNTPGQPFINNLSLNLMVVCSVSTVVFNANPLMRYDGYYVLADWLEIPNLRERSNRFLKNVVLEHCLGVEVHPEPYMALWRRCLFVSYAIVSYVYRWVVTFGILYFLDSFLKPYKLQVISHLLAVAAFASLTGWPIGRLIRNVYKRGRLPDMKRWRVVVSCSVVVGLVLFLCVVPVPLSRVRGVGLVQPQADATQQLFVRQPGTLEELHVRPGDSVKKGDLIARFRNLDLEADLESARQEVQNHIQHLKLVEWQRRQTKDPKERERLIDEETKTQSKKGEAEEKLRVLERARDKELVLQAPIDGVIGVAPRLDEVGKWFDKDPIHPFCTINQPRRLRVALPLTTAEFNRLKENLERLTSAAESTLKLMHKRVKLDGQAKPLSEAIKQLEKQVRGLHLWLDSETMSGDPTVQCPAGPVPLATALAEMLSPHGLGYVIHSEENDRHDGWVCIRPGRERGTPLEGRARFKVTDTALAALRGAGVPDAAVSKLEPLKGKELGRQAFLRALARVLPPEELRRYQDLLLNHAEGQLEVTVRIHGRDQQTWKGRLEALPESEARTIPLQLSNKQGGPVAVKAQGLTPQQAAKAGAHSEPLTPQTQQYIVYVDLLPPVDDAIVPGETAQVKIRCQPETCLHWLWRTVNDVFDLGLW
jgi:putative peptide zinc metalloprotease protein